MEERRRLWLLLLLSVAAVVSFVLVITIAEKLGGKDEGEEEEDCKQSWQSAFATYSPSNLSSRAPLLAFELSAESDFRSHLSAVAVERTVGSAGSARVRRHIRAALEGIGWSVERDEFQDQTPDGNKTFVNIIAHSNPRAHRRIVIACHYDSKSSIPHFVAATDSAVPCAMMLHLATVMAPLIKENENADLALSFVFFDGEEAFRTWSDSDSLYGSRHLADRWSKETYEGECQAGPANQLDRIQVMVLLDLIGYKNVQFNNYETFFSNSFNVFFDMMVRAERTILQDARAGEDDVRASMFNTAKMPSPPEDDYSPFVSAGFDRFLYLIASPFPEVWHTPADSVDNLDWGSIARLNRLMRVWTAQALGCTAEQVDRAFKTLQ